MCALLFTGAKHGRNVSLIASATMDVVLLRWPSEGGRRQRMKVAGEARLLLVEDDQPPPRLVDCLEDWIRVPAPEEDVRARVDALVARSQAHEHRPPGVDTNGVLRYEGKWIALPPLEARLTETLLERFGAVGGRETLIRAVWPGQAPGRNALDVHILRLRRRLRPLGLAIRTVRSRGYLLEPESGHAQDRAGEPVGDDADVGAGSLAAATDLPA
jgi:two-component system OmpR family response regulator